MTTVVLVLGLTALAVGVVTWVLYLLWVVIVGSAKIVGRR